MAEAERFDAPPADLAWVRMACGLICCGRRAGAFAAEMPASPGRSRFSVRVGKGRSASLLAASPMRMLTFASSAGIAFPEARITPVGTCDAIACETSLGTVPAKGAGRRGGKALAAPGLEANKRGGSGTIGMDWDLTLAGAESLLAQAVGKAPQSLGIDGNWTVGGA